MKEFVEKLIGRLEELRKEYYADYNIYRVERDLGNVDGLKHAIKIINELAEEYEPCTKSCTDCEAYDLVKHNCPKFCKVIKGTVEEIKENYNHGWIPCSERLPEKYGEYLCCDRYGEYIIGYPTVRGCKDSYYVETEYEIMNDVIAWQSLPQPYKEGSGENE